MRGARSSRKKLGQCFLVDGSVADRIVRRSGIRKGERALEVGPGRGILTRRLLRAGAIVHAVELDEKLYERLKQEMEGEDNLLVDRANALKFDYSSIGTPYKIISNLPYSVSVPLIKKFLENADRISSMTLMVQAEVGKRLTASPGDSSYGSLSLYVAYHCDVEYLFTVPPGAFRPRPKVDSAVIQMIPFEEPPVSVPDKERFFDFIGAAFVHRRKTIRNNLRKFWDNVDILEKAFADAYISPDLRPQDISLQEFARLFDEWLKTGRKA